MFISTRRHRVLVALTIAVWVTLGAFVALVLLTLRTPNHSHAARPLDAVAVSTPRPRPPTPPRNATNLSSAVQAAYAYGHDSGYRLGIAVTDLDSGKEWDAGDPGTFGTGSVIKALIATKMLLIGAMQGADADEAYRMITYSDDGDGTDLWTRFGADQIITWLNDHYGVHFGDPNRRPYFWGNTPVTAPSLVAFYRTVSHDRAVWPWLSNAMAHSQRIAADGTDQYYGIPRAGGGQTVKQSWGTRSAGDGYGDDATVNSTGIVTVNRHRYAVVILTEGHHNDADADSRGYVRAQAEMITEVAKIIVDALHSVG